MALAALPAAGAGDAPADPAAGGPFPVRRRTARVFGNRERLLPAKARGYYREYTVPDPGRAQPGRPPHRLRRQPPTAPEACYYTADHYASFQPHRAVSAR
ncbi:MAG: ribonuclease [Comamonadaceae bacterium]|nr:ribonuclease [Comamonadaceae bacterium]